MNQLDGDFVKYGDTIIVKMHDEVDLMVKVTEVDHKIGKTKVNCTPLIGSPYGAIFEIRGRKLYRDDGFDMLTAEDYTKSAQDSTGDNRSFADTNSAQKLSNDDISKLKSHGATASDIINSLIANSKTWTSKSEFSQEKWLKRKQKKYAQKIRILKCTPASLCDVYFRKSGSKICNMRSDMLAHILSYSGACAGARMLVFESVIGLVVGAAAYRMRGQGRLLAVYFGQQPHLDLVDRLNLSAGDVEVIQPVPSGEVALAGDFVAGCGSFLDSEEALAEFVRQDEVYMRTSRGEDGASSEEHTTDVGNEDKEQGQGGDTIVTKPYNASGRQLPDLLRLRAHLREGARSLVIVSKYHPLSILQEGVRLISPGSPITVYFEFLEPLVECYLYLQREELAIKLQIFDNWMREYQTLAGRAHPHMTMPTSGGYLLVGIFIGTVRTSTAIGNFESSKKRRMV